VRLPVLISDADFMFCAVTGAVLLAGGLIAWSTTVNAKLMSACLIWGTSKNAEKTKI
jgi:hypothetical protein